MPWSKAAKGGLVRRKVRNQGYKTFFRKMAKPRLLKPKKKKK